MFGPITFRRSGRFWYGRTWFGPTGRQVGITVSAGPEGPTEAQREVMRTITSGYADLLPAAMTALLPEYQLICEAQPEEGRPPARVPEDLLRIVWLDRIVLGAESEPSGNFALCFQTDVDDNGDHEFGVQFEQGRPVMAAWEG